MLRTGNTNRGTRIDRRDIAERKQQESEEPDFHGLKLKICINNTTRNKNKISC